jgi:Mn2+/Fe2+ NRAMP family transporter
LVTLCFVAAVFRLGPDVHSVAAGLIPRMPASDRGQYGYLAVGILGATISPYLVTFYSSGGVEEEWTKKDLIANRIVAGIGTTFGAVVAVAVIIVAGLILAPRGIIPQSFTDAADILNPVFGRPGLYLFAASLGIGCIGAALELALDLSYLSAQTFGWEWGEDQAPSREARFALTYTGALLLALIPTMVGIDPLKLTMASMAFTVLALPIVIGPLMVIMNDPDYLKSYTNGWITNVAVAIVVLIGVVLAVLSIPLQFVGG